MRYGLSFVLLNDSRIEIRVYIIPGGEEEVRRDPGRVSELVTGRGSHVSPINESVYITTANNNKI